MEYRSLIITGPSGAGKDKLWDAYTNGKERFSKLITCTTRPIRQGEVHGREYYFLSLEEFLDLQKRGEMLEHAINYGNLYGSTFAELNRVSCTGKIPFFKVDVQGAKILRERVPSPYTLFVNPPSIEVLRQRLIGRNSETVESLERRMTAAIEEMKYASSCNHTLINDSFPQALEELSAVLGKVFPHSS
ncbi:MAG TPA: guanylate kinase [Candidatus Nanoarchaeia archaeon]|nr:guanylate kinase [Candidatus Nanoarchaeia archaeon]